ncbi:MAG TPA: MJ0042-type zinc finger domain-containing protein [Gemmata sp.]
MPIRLVCPSCSAALSIKDEYAGRAVKCPKCGGVIPASQPGATAPPPSQPVPPPVQPPPHPPETEPARPPAPFEALDEPVKPKARVTARPTVPPAEQPENDNESALPPRRNRDNGASDLAPPKAKKWDADDAPVAKKAKRRSLDDDGDRPTRGRKTRRGDDEDDAPAKKGGNVVLIVALVCGTLLTCCGGTGFGIYYYVIKPVKKGVEDTVQQVREDLKTRNPSINGANYGQLEVGETTRAEADAKLRNGRTATDEDLKKVFASEPARVAEWSSKVSASRAIVWQNGDEYIIAAFHPGADGTGRLQAKAWRPKFGGALSDGELDDAKFLQQYPAGGRSGLPITATELSQEYNNDAKAAAAKYEGKVLLVEGKLVNIDYNRNNELAVALKGVPKTGGGEMVVRVAVSKGEENKLLSSVTRGQTVKLRGKVGIYIGFGFVELTDGAFDSAGASLVPTVSAAALFNEYARDAEATDTKYKDKDITITSAYVERRVNDTTLMISPGPSKKAGTARIKVVVPIDDNFKKQIANLKIGDRVTIKGEYISSYENTINIHGAWIVR